MNNSTQDLSGAWEIVLTIKSDSYLPFVPSKITMLANFTDSGDFIASTDLPIMDVPLPDGEVMSLKISTGHGIWLKKGDNKFDFRIKRFVQLAELPQTLFGFATGYANISFKDNNTLIGKVNTQMFGIDNTALLPPEFWELKAERLFVKKHIFIAN